MDRSAAVSDSFIRSSFVKKHEHTIRKSSQKKLAVLRNLLIFLTLLLIAPVIYCNHSMDNCGKVLKKLKERNN